MSQSLTPLQFDNWGYLVPDQPVSVSLDMFREAFGFNVHRRELLAQHNDLLTGLRGLGIVGVEQWVNGSFVTQKPLPNDIDVLTFVPVDLHQSLESELRALFDMYPNVNAYAVRMFPESHRQYFLTNLDRIEWLSLFTRSRKDQRTNRRHPKGFVTLLID